VFESGGQRRRFADPLKLFHQHLYALGGERAHYGDQVFRAAFLVTDHGVADAGFVGKILGGIGEKRGKGNLAGECFDDGLHRLRQERVLRAVGDYFISVVRQDGKNFCSVRCCEVRPACANCDFALAGSASIAQGFDQVWAESFHRCRPQIFWLDTIVLEAPAKPTGAIAGGSIPATPGISCWRTRIERFRWRRICFAEARLRTAPRLAIVSLWPTMFGRGDAPSIVASRKPRRPPALRLRPARRARVPPRAI